MRLMAPRGGAVQKLTRSMFERKTHPESGRVYELFSVSHGDKNHTVDLWTVGGQPWPDREFFEDDDLLQSLPFLFDQLDQFSPKDSTDSLWRHCINDPQQFFFFTGKPMSSRAMASLGKSVTLEAGEEPGTNGLLRATGATEFLRGGMTEHQVAKLITGHKDPKSLEHYNQPSLTDKENMFDKAIGYFSTVHVIFEILTFYYLQSCETPPTAPNGDGCRIDNTVTTH